MIQLRSSGYEATINPLWGGNCIRLSYRDISVLRTPASAFDYQKESFFYGTPLLFFPNRISGGKFEFENRLYRFPVNDPDTGCSLHGTLYQTPFKVIDQQTDQVVLLYQATEKEPYHSFPHAFSLRLRWRLTPEGLKQEVILRNDSELNMPVALGFHTTFQLPFFPSGNATGITMHLDIDREYTRNTKNYLPDGRYSITSPDMEAMKAGIWHPAMHRSSHLFQMGREKKMILTDPDKRIQITYKALLGYNYWMVFNSLSPDWICVEPQSWLTNCPNAPFPRNETGFDFLLPGQSRTYLTCLNIHEEL